jgi:hypothetical protein
VPWYVGTALTWASIPGIAAAAHYDPRRILRRKCSIFKGLRVVRNVVLLVVLAAAHLDHNPRNNRLRNLKRLCQRCHMIHDRPHHLAQRRITYFLRRALGDLFLGPYSLYFGLQAPGPTLSSDGQCLG